MPHLGAPAGFRDRGAEQKAPRPEPNTRRATLGARRVTQMTRRTRRTAMARTPKAPERGSVVMPTKAQDKAITAAERWLKEVPNIGTMKR